MKSEYLSEIVDEIIEDLPLAERVLIANINEIDIQVLQEDLGRYVQGKIQDDPDDFKNVIFEVYERLRDTHKLRVVK